jgi:hypothetical protein
MFGKTRPRAGGPCRPDYIAAWKACQSSSPHVEYKGHFAPLFSFYIIYATEPALRIGAIETDWFEPYVKAHAGEVALSPRDNDLVISSPETLRAFLLKHEKDQGAIAQAVFVRREIRK